MNTVYDRPSQYQVSLAMQAFQIFCWHYGLELGISDIVYFVIAWREQSEIEWTISHSNIARITAVDPRKHNGICVNVYKPGGPGAEFEFDSKLTDELNDMVAPYLTGA